MAANLTLYTTTAVLILDSEGHRILAKYYQPPHALLPDGTPRPSGGGPGGPPQLVYKNPFGTLKEQRAFEKAVFDKTRRAGQGEIILYEGHLVLFKASLDTILYVVGPAGENELMLSGLLGSLHDSILELLRGLMEKRAVLENLDLVTLAIDETVDDGIILETDSQTIASRVSRPRPDTTDIQINEQSQSSIAAMQERLLRMSLAERVMIRYSLLHSHYERIFQPKRTVGRRFAIVGIVNVAILIICLLTVSHREFCKVVYEQVGMSTHSEKTLYSFSH